MTRENNFRPNNPLILNSDSSLTATPSNPSMLVFNALPLLLLRRMERPLAPLHNSHYRFAKCQTFAKGESPVNSPGRVCVNYSIRRSFWLFIVERKRGLGCIMGMDWALKVTHATPLVFVCHTKKSFEWEKK